MTYVDISLRTLVNIFSQRSFYRNNGLNSNTNVTTSSMSDKPLCTVVERSNRTEPEKEEY